MIAWFKSLFQSKDKQLLPQQDNSVFISGDEIKVGRQIIRRQFLQKHKISKNVSILLSKHYVKFQKQANTEFIKIGVNQRISAQFLQDLLSNLTSSTMHGFTFVGIEFPLFNQVAKIDFDILERIQLVNCKISNIEPFSWINSSKFKTTYLDNNMITSIKPLHKTKWNDFLSLSLDNNPIKDFSPLCRAQILNKRQDVRDQFFLYLTQEIIHIGDINFLFKIQKKQTRFIGQQISSKGHIRQIKHLQAIKRQQVSFQLKKTISQPQSPSQMIREERQQQPQIQQQQQVIQQ